MRDERNTSERMKVCVEETQPLLRMAPLRQADERTNLPVPVTTATGEKRWSLAKILIAPVLAVAIIVNVVAITGQIREAVQEIETVVIPSLETRVKVEPLPQLDLLELPLFTQPVSGAAFPLRTKPARF